LEECSAVNKLLTAGLLALASLGNTPYRPLHKLNDVIQPPQNRSILLLAEGSVILLEGKWITKKKLDELIERGIQVEVYELELEKDGKTVRTIKFRKVKPAK
jgi:hypothetical protein